MLNIKAVSNFFYYKALMNNFLDSFFLFLFL